MKKMFVGLTACALIFTSCSNNEIFENTSQANAIQFSKLSNGFTKVANDNVADYRVFAAWSVSDRAWYMDHKLRGHDNYYTPQKYWPEKGMVSFYAYSPYSDEKSDNFKVTHSPTASITGVYTVEDKAQEDFTIAAVPSSEKDGTVSLIFNHMLSRITMKIVTADELSGYEVVNPSAKFTLDYNSANFDVMSETPMKTFVGEADAFEYSLLSSEHSLTSKYLNVLPQPANNGGQLQLTVTIIDKATGAIFIPERTLAPIMLNSITALANGQLEGGKWYKFTVTITDESTGGGGEPLFNAITVSAAVSDWGQGIPVPPLQP